MRSVLILVIGLALLVGGFFIYYVTQSTGPGAGSSDPRLAATTLPVEMPNTGDATGQVAGPGTDVWIQTFDEKTNRVAFQFRASRYDPQPEGPVNVTNPQAELFTGTRSDDRQVIRIEGKSGRVVMPTSAAQRATFGSGGDTSAPRRGELHDVTISLFDESDLARPLLVCRVNNIAFDNDTYRIATESYHDGTREVPADEVPIEVRGEDFDFDGRGLTIRWNEADRRLQLLEIAHGQRLVIKSPEMLRAFDGAQPPGRSRAPRAQGVGDLAVLAAAHQAPPVPRDVPQPSGSAAAAPPPVYRASFRDEVRITRSDAVLAEADQMLVDFISDSDEPISTPGAARRKSATDDPLPPAQRRRGDPAPAGKPGAPADTGDAVALPPVVVHWLGKLRVTALEGETPRPAPGSLNIAMSSEQRAVVLNHRGLDVRCAAFDYRSGDDSLTVTSSKAIPAVELKLADGTMVHTPSIVYSGAESQALLRGTSRAVIPLAGEDGGAGQVLRAAWTETCLLSFSGNDLAEAGLRPERALFTGDVHVEHPQLTLHSDALELGFDPSADTAQPAPNELKATGAVQCRLVDSAGNRQDIQCDELQATVAAAEEQGGKIAPKTFTAEGNVVAANVDGELRAGHLTVALAPASAAAPEAREDGARAPARARAGGAKSVWGGGEFEIESITAQQDVKLSLREGGGATADQVHLTLTPQGTVARLLGQPATLSDGSSTLSGPHITYEQGAQKLAVQGPGTLAFSVRDTPEQPPRPVTIAWQTSLDYDGINNAAQIAGSAGVRADAPDGSTQLATSDRIEIALADAPDSANPPPAAGDTDAPHQRGDHLGLAAEKTIRQVTLAGNAEIQSVLLGEADQVRRMHLLAPQVNYDVQQQRVEVPTAGRMLVQDTLPARPQPHDGNRLLGNFRGATAFQWADHLVFDQSIGRMVMAGSVMIVHEDPQQADQSFRLEAAQVSAQMLEDEARSTRAREGGDAASMNPTPLFGATELRLKTLSATGEIRLNSPQIQLDAHEVVYDAVSELLTARGSERMPVELYREPGISRGSFQEVIWNARTEQIQLRDVQAQVRQ